MLEKTYPKFTLPGAEQELEQICKERIRSLYGNDPPSLVMQRLEGELAMMAGTNYTSVYMLMHRLVRHMRQKGHRWQTHDSFSGTLVSYLLGITEENPLPAHYACPNCKRTQWFFDVVSGYDLPDKLCPHCGEALLGMGQNMPYETWMGLFPGEKEPCVEMHLMGSAWEAAVHFLVQFLGQECIAIAGEWNNPVCFLLLPEGMDFADVAPITMLEDGVCSIQKKTDIPAYELQHILQKVLLLPSDDDTLPKLHHLTNTKPEDIRYNDPNVYRLFREGKTDGIPEFSSRMGKELLRQLTDARFSDLVRISGILRNGNPAEQPFYEQICDRDAIFLTLQKYGVDRETAYAVMESVRRGKFANNDRLEKKMHAAGIPKGYIEAMKRIAYLWPRSLLVPFAKRCFCLAWFRCYYPEQVTDVDLMDMG